MKRSGVFRISDLERVASATQWSARPQLGALVQLNSGGPVMMVVDFDGDDYRVAIGAQEYRWPLQCLRPA